MPCVQNNRIYCSDCNKSYIPNHYSNHLKSKGHNINVMKKHCCSCNNDITHSNNHDLTCSMSKLFLKSDVDIETGFSDKQDCSRRKIIIDSSVRYNPKSEQAEEKNIDNYKNTAPHILLDLFRRKHGAGYFDSESIVDGLAILNELRRVGEITCETYNKLIADRIEKL